MNGIYGRTELKNIPVYTRAYKLRIVAHTKRLTNFALTYYFISYKSQGRSRMAFPPRMCCGGHNPEWKSGRCGKRARLAGEQLDIAEFTWLLLSQKNVHGSYCPMQTCRYVSTWWNEIFGAFEGWHLCRKVRYDVEHREIWRCLSYKVVAGSTFYCYRLGTSYFVEELWLLIKIKSKAFAGSYC
jgi:hypothetical protein